MSTWQSDVRPIQSMTMKHVRHAFASDDAIDAQWQKLNYLSRPDLKGALTEYQRLVSLFEGMGIELLFLPEAPDTGMDSLYARDAALTCDRGVILCNMGKPDRRGEPAAQRAFYLQQGIPVAGEITGLGSIEGGDVAWVDERTLAVANGYRTNDEGVRQLRDLLGDCVDEVVVVDLPHFRGPSDVFHLMSIFSPIDVDLAVVYSPLMPVRFRELLKSRGIQLVEVPEEEFDSMGCNVLATAPRRCVMVEGNPITGQRLLDAGAEIHEYCGKEISLKGCGGPTCLTRPLIRS